MSSARTVVAYIGLGANLGDRVRTMHAAVRRILEFPATRVDLPQGISSLYETSPHGVSDAQPPYLNAVICIGTELPPHRLFDELRKSEELLQRVRTHRGAARLIDLDLLLYGDLVLGTPDLTIPHPRLHERRFVLEPLAEIAPDINHPVLKRSAAHLLQEAARTHADECVTQMMTSRQWWQMLSESAPQVGSWTP